MPDQTIEIFPGILACYDEPGLTQDILDIPGVRWVHTDGEWLIVYFAPADGPEIKRQIELLLQAEVPEVFRL